MTDANFNIKKGPDSLVVALAGNPNTGKSTIFNALTGLRQHTGNWPGKTVVQAQGHFLVNQQKYTLVDLPGAYSLLPNSLEEIVARDFLYFGKPDATVVVTDATCLERNLNLALQIMELTEKVIVCVNLMDEAKKKEININIEALSKELGVPVVATAAREKMGLNNLIKTVHKVAMGELKVAPRLIIYDSDIEKAVAELIPLLEKKLLGKLNYRWIALRIIAGETSILDKLQLNEVAFSCTG